MRIVDLRGKALTASLVNTAVPRAALDIETAVDQIKPLLDDVRVRGEKALVDVAMRFEKVDPRPFLVSKEELDAAERSLSSELREAILESIKRVREVAKANMPAGTSVDLATGARVQQRWQPVESVGLYVPGGKAVYPSSVVMNVVPAQVAGVPRLALASPAQQEFGGRPHPTVLATAKLLGVTEAYSIGGPAAVAAFAFGVESIGLQPVALVTGPGNIFVAAAKRALRGRIGIDSEAGTTEILILADESADARLIAFDLVSQAEHDEAAAAVLVTHSETLAKAVLEALEAVVATTKHRDRVSVAIQGQQSAIVLVDDLDAGRRFANHYATEHLEVHTQNPQADADLISNAGAIFLGRYSPVSLGDYIAGSNHVLPTGTQARFGAGLGVHTFLRAQQLIDYNQDALAAVTQKVLDFAEAEGLPAHGDAIEARFN
jgi:histidinol dehydrogenase